MSPGLLTSLNHNMMQLTSIIRSLQKAASFKNVCFGGSADFEIQLVSKNIINLHKVQTVKERRRGSEWQITPIL